MWRILDRNFFTLKLYSHAWPYIVCLVILHVRFSCGNLKLETTTGLRYGLSMGGSTIKTVNVVIGSENLLKGILIYSYMPWRWILITFFFFFFLGGRENRGFCRTIITWQRKRSRTYAHHAASPTTQAKFSSLSSCFLLRSLKTMFDLFEISFLHSWYYLVPLLVYIYIMYFICMICCLK